MNDTIQEQILKEIRRRALQRADALRQERQFSAKTKHTVAALQEVTGLHPNELESIVDAAKRSLHGSHDDFFSIKRQMLITFGILSLVLILCGFVAII